jgi:hypothetical protein
MRNQNEREHKFFNPYAFSTDALVALASAALISGKNLFFGKALADKLSPCKIIRHVFKRLILLSK